MNGDDAFEERLRSQPLRQAPPAWRSEVLRAAQAAARPGPSPACQHDRPPRLETWLARLLWPNAKAWAGLAAVWVLILGLNLAGREPSNPARPHPAAAPSAQTRDLLKEQQRMLVELLSPIDSVSSIPHRSFSPKPHTQRRLNSSTT